MFALDTISRALFAAGAFAAFGAAFVTTPLVARGDPGSATEPTPQVAPRPAPTVLGNVVPRRDPFDGGDDGVRRLAGAPQAGVNNGSIATIAQAPPPPRIPALLHALPPNAGAEGTASPFAAATASAAVVRAVVTGPHPFALVDAAGTTRLLTVGDRVDGVAIVTIGIDGVRLSSGTLLQVSLPSISGGR